MKKNKDLKRKKKGHSLSFHFKDKTIKNKNIVRNCTNNNNKNTERMWPMESLSSKNGKNSLGFCLELVRV